DERLTAEIRRVDDRLTFEIRGVRDELHGIKGLVAKWLIGTVVAVIGTMIAQTTLILSAVRLPG
ncbi:MAG: hypothetical protein LBT98_01050, partial [Puniceicoccales bacterium]|nr:hypothetical protein [Puniceicoccales bacterium]